MKDKILNLLGENTNERYYNLMNLVFISVILIASFASLFHVRGFWLITNTPFWATFLAISTGLGIIGSLMASRYTLWTQLSLILIIIMELIGNVFDSFMNINPTSQGFQTFKQLFQPIFEMFYIVGDGDVIDDVIYMRIIAIIEGAFIPILVVIMFHIWMYVRSVYKSNLEKETTSKTTNEVSNQNEDKLTTETKNENLESEVEIKVDPPITIIKPTEELQLHPIVETSIEEPIISKEVDSSIENLQVQSETIDNSTIDHIVDTVNDESKTVYSNIAEFEQINETKVVKNSIEVQESDDSKKKQLNLLNRLKNWLGTTRD